jgi:hypothetical protein
MQTSQAPQTPEITALSLSHLCASYLKVLFQSRLNARMSQPIGTSTAPPTPPLLLPLALALELDRIAVTLADAFQNRGQ